MFIKKIKKDKDTYYILTICEKVEKGKGKGQNKDTLFHSDFIPEKLAQFYVDCGVSLIEKNVD